MPTDRSAQRQRTFLKAEIETVGGLSGLSCWVKDLSEDGARLQLSEGAPLPDHFRIRLKDRWLQASVKWRRDGFVGVHFEDDEGVKRPSGPKSGQDRIRVLEGEIARMRQMLEQIRADPSRLREVLGLDA